jgi:acyl-CoA reductase-like NAD-dependent aldehyde dehydrogenase
LEKELVEMANDSVYGLCASVWTQNTARGQKLAGEIQAGSVWVNSAHLLPHPKFPGEDLKKAVWVKKIHVSDLKK